MNNFTSRFEREIKKDYGFNLAACGGSIPDKISEISLRFDVDRVENISGARKLVIPIALRMIERMNQDPELISQFVNDISIKNITLRLLFRKENDCKDAEHLHSVVVIGLKEKVFYDVNNETMTRLVEIHEETFEEAIQILKMQGTIN